MKNIIEVINVTKKYGGFILDNINFTFPLLAINPSELLLFICLMYNFEKLKNLNDSDS